MKSRKVGDRSQLSLVALVTLSGPKLVELQAVIVMLRLLRKTVKVRGIFVHQKIGQGIGHEGEAQEVVHQKRVIQFEGEVVILSAFSF